MPVYVCIICFVNINVCYCVFLYVFLCVGLPFGCVTIKVHDITIIINYKIL